MTRDFLLLPDISHAELRRRGLRHTGHPFPFASATTAAAAAASSAARSHARVSAAGKALFV